MKSLAVLLASILIPQITMSQTQPNYDESKVPALHLPDPFVSEKGKLISSVEDWEKLRRPEIFSLFESEVYGQLPTDFNAISFEVVKENPNPFPELADLEEVTITVSRNEKNHTMRINFFLPKSQKGPFPVILLINYLPKYPDGKLVDESFWPVRELIQRGFATASFHVETVAPDDAKTYQNGIISTLYPEQIGKADGLKAFGAWGWAAMRAMDYFEQHPRIDSKKSILVGHSRTGKTALWTSANDPRWAITYANESGCGGAALSKRKFGETVEAINNRFPHWFADNFRKYNGKEESLSLDQHLLPGLIAPRAVYYSSAKEDQWADPKGEYLGIQLGSRVASEIYGKKAVFEKEFEELDGPVHLESVGYHIREGAHDLTWEDWRIFLEFVEKNL
ncbi:acetylxylan esterase [Algoriphagus sp. AK58]|uniref:glucuronyl esterase domain-containing protein n=1 Tax=Algoriphagus sp. AK58 TaxID=1406877 RepID=UPI001650026D|nr:acetylxylan esterase [Algoriphagus sp. AK58]MBC6366898.1 acetylxylan esterase [Algoriphagus sp. AK58]